MHRLTQITHIQTKDSTDWAIQAKWVSNFTLQAKAVKIKEKG